MPPPVLVGASQGLHSWAKGLARSMLCVCLPLRMMRPRGNLRPHAPPPLVLDGSKPWLAQLAQGRALRRQLAFIPPGSLLLTSKFRGPWGLFESLEKWVSGAWSGHMALVLTGPCVQSEEAQGPGREGRKPQGTGGLGLTAMDQPTGDEGAETEREPGQGREGKGVETGAEGGGRVDQGTVDREAEHIRQGDGGSRPRTEADEGCLWVAESGRIGPGVSHAHLGLMNAWASGPT